MIFVRLWFFSAFTEKSITTIFQGFKLHSMDKLRFGSHKKENWKINTLNLLVGWGLILRITGNFISFLSVDLHKCWKNCPFNIHTITCQNTHSIPFYVSSLNTQMMHNIKRHFVLLHIWSNGIHWISSAERIKQKHV